MDYVAPESVYFSRHTNQIYVNNDDNAEIQ